MVLAAFRRACTCHHASSAPGSPTGQDRRVCFAIAKPSVAPDRGKASVRSLRYFSDERPLTHMKRIASSKGGQMFHKGISLLGAGVLAASAIGVPISAYATTAVSTTIARHIEGSDGAAFGAGTPVVVWTTPSQDELAAAKVGDSFTNTPIASGSLDSAGSFRLPIDDVASLSKYASKDRLLNLEVRAAEGTDVAPFALSRKIVTVGETTALVDPSDLANSQATTATAAQVAAANKPAAIVAQAAPQTIAKKNHG